MDNLISTELFDLNRYSSSLNGDVILYVTSKNFDGGAQLVYSGINADVNFYELRVNNWDDNLTPWEADPKMKGRHFRGEAGTLLTKIKDEVIPLINNSLSQDSKIYIAGYSLAGLFSLWALYESKVFFGAACCSGSLWYPGWKDYVGDKTLPSDFKVYLSIGNREKISKNIYMKEVEDIYLYQYDLLKNICLLDNVHMDINEGGHFNDVNERVIKGINYLIKKVSE